MRTCENLPFVSFVGQGWYMGVQVWNGHGTVGNNVWNETARSSAALPPRSTLSKVAVWSESSAASSQAHLYHQTFKARHCGQQL